ncbi:MAG TPA: phage tail sheath family protein [Acidimicrobiales bacterium]|nr:phage tail sheath family protein [Acidimicrobiales bacterium]
MPQYLSPGVYVEEVDSGSRPIEGVGTAVAAFIGLAPKGPTNQPTLVTNWSQYTQTFGEFTEGWYLAHAVYGYFLNGGGSAYVVRVNDDGQAPAQATARAELPAGGEARVGAYRVESLLPGAAGNEISVEVSVPDDSPDDVFKLTIRGGGKVEEYEGLTTKRGRQNAMTVVNAQSKLVKLAEAAPPGGLQRPNPGTTTLVGGGAPAVAAPVRLTPQDYVGDPAERSGVGGLEAIDTVTMVAVPDLLAAHEKGILDSESLRAVQLGLIAHCEKMGDRVAIIDPPAHLNAQQIYEWRREKAGYDSKQATLYWPWIKVFDPASGQNIFVPPSGHMAGVWARNDNTRGVHKAPANEVVRGAISLELNITKNEHDLLNPEGINCIRSFPSRGVRIWGARTLSSDPAWRYVNVRRLFNYLEKSILNGTDWVVFEPNDLALWAKIRRTIASFLVMEWRKGALFGASAGDAFYVKCDGETNPAEGIDLGQVVCEIGVAPVKPAEFVIFRMSQFSGGTSLVEA